MKTTKFTKREEEAIKELFKKGTVHPNYYSGTGRFSKRSAEHAIFLKHAIERGGMKNGVHFKTGNDAERGGHTGEFVKLLSRGKKLKSFSKFL